MQPLSRSVRVREGEGEGGREREIDCGFVGIT